MDLCRRLPGILFLVSLAATGCATLPARPEPLPSVAPPSQPSVSLALKPSAITPMYRELLAVDLPTVIRVANAQNLDIQQARQQVEASRGRYESNVGAVFPVIAPWVAYTRFQGVAQNANGTLTPRLHYSDLLAGISVKWILNPGAVAYDIVASKRRMEASAHQEQSVAFETTRLAAVLYYDLVLAQAQVQVAHQGVEEATELVRLTQLQVKIGTGLPADALRAEAQLAGFEQDVVNALNSFYQASVALTLALRLDPVVTLVPAGGEVKQTTLVREDIPIEELLTLAAKYRPDLAAVRSLLRAAHGDTRAVAWGDLGPQLHAIYTAARLKTNAPKTAHDWKDQQKTDLGAGFSFSMSTFGDLKTAHASERIAAVGLQRQLDLVQAAVVSAQQNSASNAKLIPVARKQLDSAQEALRLTQANHDTGTALLVDVLQAQNTADDARLRFVAAVVHYNQSQVNLLAALGLLGPDSLTSAPAAAPAPPR